MPERIILTLLMIVLSFEVIYVVFRAGLFTIITTPLIAASVVLSCYYFVTGVSLTGFISLSSLLLLLTAKKFLKTKLYEKPDYRYLLILTGVLLYHLK
ncbi:MAG TPA: hypothetical protein PKW56_03295 [Clostridiales bacterium]|nr:hypothetical protein [Candidatus Delongbacteria bacterium]HXK49468.1 hypothetical protein [Clostridiales bacterium]